MGLTLQRIVLILLCATLSIGLLWCIMKPILLFCGQDESIINLASTYIVFSLIDLVIQAFLHPLRIYHDEPYFHLFYFIENCIDVVLLPRIGTNLDPNPRLYQAPRGIKSPEVQTSSQVLHTKSYSRRGLHLWRFDPSRPLIEPRT